VSYRARSVLTGLVLAGAIVSACRPSNPNIAPGLTPTPNPPTVTVAAVQRGDIQSTLSYAGSVQASASVNVVPRISARIERLAVDVGSVVKAGDLIAVLDSRALQAQVDQARAAVAAAQARLDQMKAGARPESVEQARANLAMAQAKLQSLLDGPRPEAVAQAKANLDAARAKLAQLQAGPTPEQVKAAELAVAQARNSLYAAQIQKDGDCNPHNPEYLCKASQARALAAQTAVEQAEQQLAILKAPPTKEQIEQAEAAVAAAEQQYRLALAPYTQNDIAQARASVAAAQAQLRLAENPYTEEDIRASEAAVAQARAGLEQALAQLDDARVTAPIDGVVSQKLLEQGALAGPTTPIVTIISRSVEVHINVEESRLALFTPQLAATVQVPAYPGVSFPARVIGDPPSVDPRSRTAEVRLSVEDPKGQLRPGMYAQVTLVAQKRSNVLTVPVSALINDNGQSEVYLVSNERIKVQPVQVGLQDAEKAEITAGLAEGQIVVIGDKPILHNGDRVHPQPVGR